MVITGTLHHFENREELTQEIEKRGGKVSSSVSSKTTYLVNNDLNSTSGKIRKQSSWEFQFYPKKSFLPCFESSKQTVKNGKNPQMIRKYLEKIVEW